LDPARVGAVVGSAVVVAGVTHSTGAPVVAAFSASPFSPPVSTSVSSSACVTEIKLLNPRPRRDFGFCIFATIETPFPSVPPHWFHVERAATCSFFTLPNRAELPQTSTYQQVQ
jgi:hypothetical protein